MKLADLNQFIGTNAYHRYQPGWVLTDGAKYLAEGAGCYWLYDIAWSVSGKLDVSFNTLEIQQTEADGCRVFVTDGNNNELYTQDVEHTDFPFNETGDHYKLFVVRGSLDGATPVWVIMLTGEY